MNALDQFGRSSSNQLAASPAQSRWTRFITDCKTALQPSVAWWVPYWFHTRQIWCVCRLLFAPRSVLRVTVLSLIIGYGIVACVEATVPGVALPPLWKLLLCIPLFYGYTAIMILLHLAIPTHVKVRKARIHSTTGQANWLAKAEAIHRTRIVVFALDRIRLRIFYTRNNRKRSRTFGVSPKINLNALCANLPVYPQIWDARGRYRNAVAVRQVNATSPQATMSNRIRETNSFRHAG